MFSLALQILALVTVSSTICCVMAAVFVDVFTTIVGECFMQILSRAPIYPALIRYRPHVCLCAD